MTLDLAGRAGRLDALLDLPAGDPRVGVVFAHPHPQYGGTMHTKVVYRAAKTLADLGCAVLRFNFRGAGLSEGEFNNGSGEADDFRTALDGLHDRYGDIEMWAGGFSFGSWIAARVGAVDERIDAYIGIGLPADSYDFSSLESSPKPKFFIHGERDEICPLADVRRLYGRLPEPKDLVVIDGASHLFDGKVLEVGDALEDLLSGFSARSRPAGT